MKKIGVRKRSAKIAKEIRGLAISDMSHFPWCRILLGFAVETKAPPASRGANVRTGAIASVK